MRKKALLTATFILLTGLTTSVVGGPNASKGELAITSASGTTAVDPNGTIYETHFSVTDRATSANQTGVTNYSINNDTVSFTGVVKTPTPCYQLRHNVEETGNNSYRFNVKMQDTNKTCAQVINYQTYEAEFTAERPYTLSIQHSGEELENLEVGTVKEPDREDKEYQENSDGFIAKIMTFFQGLF
ncbi:MAG: hypothetical protein ABEK00_01665 [Candidatus Nanohaloarchaea archaeon]